MRCAGLNVSRVPKDPRDSEFQGIEDPLLTRAFDELASPKSKGFQGKYIHKYDLDQNIIVRAWCNHICDHVLFMGKTGPMGERTPRRA